jgi:hypothetical protein
MASSGKKPAAAASDSGDKKKPLMLGIAAVAFVAAAVLILFQLGVFGGEEAIAPPPSITEGMSDAERKQWEAEQARREKLDKIIPPSGS